MQKTFTIDAFPQGYYMSWLVTTQADYLVQAKLFDSTTVYFDASKQGIDIEPPLAQGAATILGAGLQLSIEIDTSNDMDNSLNTFTITNAHGDAVGYGYNIFIEDSTDADYNDVCVVLIAWRSKG